jgi:hypothetical protein
VRQGALITNQLFSFSICGQKPQKGYGAFTHSRSQINTMAKYILTQEGHHKTKPFKEEYLEILEKNNIEFKEEYLFESSRAHSLLLAAGSASIKKLP